MDPVTTAEFDAALKSLEAQIDDPVAGLFGPGSEVWTKQGETVVFAAAGRAALLQLAHPAVAQAVEEFSITREDPVTRFRNTFFYVFAMVFGDLRTATRMARTVHRVHQRVTGTIRDTDAGPEFPPGTPYHANDPEAQLWVASTLIESSAWVYETLVRPLDHTERKRWIAELPRFTALFGIPRSLLFPTWGAFEDYNRRMWASDTLTVSSTARSLMRALTTPPTLALAPLWRVYTNFTAGSLPPSCTATGCSAASNPSRCARSP